MKTLALSPDLKLPADEAIAQKYAFVGRSGSGKTYAALRLAELMLHAGAQVIALDWVGIWWSLRLAANGKTPAFEDVYIFGGEHADVPLEPTAGAVMADLVVDKHISVVLDVMHFRKAERIRFATDFAEQFFHRKKSNRSAVHLFVEEAQAYLPQMVKGDVARMVGAFEDIGKVGRNYGIGNTLITQRPQSVNKDVLNQAEILFAFQTNGPQERKALKAWIVEAGDSEEASLVDELPQLQKGDCYVWSPSWLRTLVRTHISRRETYDASSTPTQHAKMVRPKMLAPADLEALGESIKATVEKQKAKDPTLLQRKVAELERQLAKVQTSAPTITKSMPVHVISARELQHIDRVIEQAHAGCIAATTGVQKSAQVLADEVKRLTGKLLELKAATTAAPAPPRAVAADVQHRPTVVASTPHARAHAKQQGAAVVAVDGQDVTLGAPHRQILAVLAQHGGCKAGKLALLCRKRWSGGFRNYLSALRSVGYLSGSNTSTMEITEAGRRWLGPYDPLPVGRELADSWLRSDALERTDKAVLTIVLDHPQGLTGPQIAQRADKAWSGGFRNVLSRLRTAGVIIGKNTEAIRPAPDLL
jgi:hypothetical protein